MELTIEQQSLLDSEFEAQLQLAKDNCAQMISTQDETITAEDLDLISRDAALGLAQSILSDPGRWGLCSDNDVRSESWKWAKHTVELEKQHDAALMTAASELVSLEEENTRLKALMQEFISAIDSDEIILKENFDNDGWENCGGRLYDKFKQALEGVNADEHSEDVCDLYEDDLFCCDMDDDEEEDPFSDTIASGCSCGAYHWSNKAGKWVQISDCIC